MSKLIIVPTPIGNLKDITLRALEVLATCDLILAEDTRTSSVLLNHFEINKPLWRYHQHNEHTATANIILKLKEGSIIALISDAGTPGISDAGFFLIRACIAENIEVECLPGATAFVPALVCSGFSTQQFVYVGFLPLKKGRQTMWKQLAEEKRSIVLYESPHRIEKMLQEICTFLGEDRQVCISREISKKFEEHKRGTALELFNFYTSQKIKGEVVVSIQGMI
ncbi:MAG: 16S rRNA (cytidine(1402)-2'-O)-methyltransferase [Chitinophagaceae bacterium]|nr:16S rRNA (cytidine(1402)-2'-O)-methyltransferase [Chitinophagaceae bacterium]